MRSRSEVDPGASSTHDIWIFGYGSLIWRPDFDYLEREVATVQGWSRRFWQGSHDHRGTPDQPGRVVTLAADPSQACTGIAYRLPAASANSIFQALDHREKNGYQRLELSAITRDRRELATITYIAAPGNFAYLGPAPLAQIGAQIARSHGPSGPNTQYLFELADALRSLQVEDDHVFALEQQVRQLLDPSL